MIQLSTVVQVFGVLFLLTENNTFSVEIILFKDEFDFLLF